MLWWGEVYGNGLGVIGVRVWVFFRKRIRVRFIFKIILIILRLGLWVRRYGL